MQMVPVPFYGDTILAVQSGDKVLVSVKRICDSLGVSVQSQLDKLKKAQWSGVTMILTPDARGREQSHSVIPVDSLPMWLVTINPSKIAEPLRDKLRKYQLEARDVLARHFMPPVAAPPAIKPTTASSTLDLIAMAELLASNFRRHYELEQNVQIVQAGQLQLEQRNRDLEAKLAETKAELTRATEDATRALRTVTSESDFHTLVTWAEEQGIRLGQGADSAEGKIAKAMCLAHGITPGKWRGPRYTVGTYPEHILRMWLDDYRSRNRKAS